MSRLEEFERKNGRTYGRQDYDNAAERLRTAPNELNDIDVEVLRHFGGDRVAAEAQRRRFAVGVPDAVVPPSKPAPSSPVKWQHVEGADLDAMIANNKDYPVKFGFLMGFLNSIQKHIQKMNQKNIERNKRLDTLEANQRAHEIRVELLEAQIRALEADRDAVGVER